MPSTIQRILARRRIERTFRRLLGYELNLGAPSTYCEKVPWLKLFYLEHDPRVVRCTDKYEVRGYLEGMGIGAHLPRLFGVWDDLGDIEWDGLPTRFALKLNNGSGRN